jgi:hypothetical protein
MRRRLPAVATLPAVHAAHLPVLAGAWLVVVAGLNKLWRPEPTARAMRAVLSSFTPRQSVPRVTARALGIIELSVGCGVLASHAGAWVWALSVLYALFACFVVAALATGAPLQSCGCFGASDRAPSAIHVALDAAIAAFGIATVTDRSLGAPHDTLVAHRGLGAAVSLGIALAAVLVLRRSPTVPAG